MQAHHRSELRARDHVHITALSSLRTCALVVALFLCLPLCASAATHKPPAKRAHAVVTAAVQEADAGILLAPWELMALKIGSVLGALLILWHFESVSGIRWEHSRELEALVRRSQAELNAKAAEVAKAQLSTEEVRKQRDAWKLEYGKPRNLYAPAELRKILGQ
jgi:hypothetical protein